MFSAGRLMINEMFVICDENSPLSAGVREGVAERLAQTETGHGPENADARV